MLVLDYLFPEGVFLLYFSVSLKTQQIEMAGTFTYANLDYLESMSMGSQEMIDEMIQIFLDQLPEFIGGLQLYLDEKRYTELGALAHKAKSSIAVMGMEGLTADLKDLELKAKAGETPEIFPELVNRFVEQVTITKLEMEEYLISH